MRRFLRCLGRLLLGLLMPGRCRREQGGCRDCPGRWDCVWSDEAENLGPATPTD